MSVVNRITMAEFNRWFGERTPARKPRISVHARAVTKPKKKAPRPKAPARITWRETAYPGRVVVTIDGLRLISELNRREHHMATHKRKNAQQEIVHRAFQSKGMPKTWTTPLLVTVTRVAPGRLDPTENLPSAGKHVIDQLAKEFGVNDNRDDLVKYVVLQRQAERGVYAVEIVVTSADAKGEGP